MVCFGHTKKLKKLPSCIQSSADINPSLHQLFNWIRPIQLANYVDNSSKLRLHSALTFPRTIIKQNCSNPSFNHNNPTAGYLFNLPICGGHRLLIFTGSGHHVTWYSADGHPTKDLPGESSTNKAPHVHVISTLPKVHHS